MANERGELPESWEWRTLGEIATPTGGIGFPKELQGRTELPYPFAKVSDMNLPGNEVWIRSTVNYVDDAILAKLRARVCPPGTVIFPKVGGSIATNKKRILESPAVFDNNVMGVVPSDNLESRWLYYFLLSIDLMTLAETGPLPSIRQSTLQQLEIPLPPLSEQRHIIAQIEGFARRAEEARGLRREATEWVEKLLRSAMNQCFSDETESWESQELGNLVRISARQVDPKEPAYRNLPHISGENIESGTCRLREYRTAAEDQMISGKYLFKPGDVLYSKIRPYLMKATQVNFVGVCSADMYPIESDASRLLPRFLMWSLVSDLFTQYAVGQSTRARMPKVNRKELFAYRIAFPPLAEQRRISAYLDSVQTNADAIRAAQAATQQELDALMPSVLAKAFAGEL